MQSRHHRPIATVLVVAALVGLAACGDDSTRAGQRANSTTTADAQANGTDTAATTPGTTGSETLPTADPSTFVGTNRAVNLLVLPDGSNPTVDIWAQRAFGTGPILLIEGLAYGMVSDVYGAPENMSVVAVETGAGPDATPLAGLFSAGATQHYTHLLVYDRDAATATGLLLEDVDAGNSNEFPQPLDGQALVQFYAYQLRLNPLSTGESFEQRIAGVDPSFQVGIEGVTGCAPQPRMTDQGFSPAVLGGTQRVPFDVPAGATTTFTFHAWGSENQDCADPSEIAPVPVTLQAGERAWVLLHSRDGTTIEALIVPVV